MNRKQFTCVARWTARILGTLIFVLIIAIAIGESDGLFNPMKQPVSVRIELLAMFVMWLGLIVAWKWEGV